MPLKKIWKRVFNSEIQFQVLKSQSSVELSCYTKKQRQPYSNIKKFSSYYDTFEIAADEKPETNNGECSCDDTEDGSNNGECSCDDIEDGNERIVSFWHLSNGLHNANGAFNDKKIIEYDIHQLHLTNKQHSILDLIENLYESLSFNKSVLMKSVESECLHPWVFFNVHNEKTSDQSESGIGKLKESLQKNNYKCIYGTYKQMHSIKCCHRNQKIINEIKNNAGFLIFSYKILNFDTVEQLESQWAQWSGANYLYKCCPKQWNLNKITFYKLTTHPNPWNFVYILLCEFENLMQPENLPIVCETVERLKLRGCGHVGVYKVQKNISYVSTNEKELDAKLTPEKVEKNNSNGESASSSLLSLQQSR